MSEKIKVEIPNDVSTRVEKAWFEYNAAQNILTYLTERKNLSEKELEGYYNKYLITYEEVELLKKAVAKEYIPKNLELSKCNYSFDFDYDLIIFEQVKE